jgi:3-oxoacyl-[acyl-carrier protein] reductase
MKNIAIITGGSRGIGKATALELADDGYDIWLNYRSNSEQAQKVKEEIEAKGRECVLIQFDVSSSEDVKDKLKTKVDKLNPDEERISVLVNNAGIIRDNIFHWLTQEEWEEVINTNLNGFYYVTKCVIDHMLKNRHGNIINISSVSGLMGNFGQTNYSASKAGIIASSKALAKEVARSNIRVNVVVPGLIKTDMSKEMQKNKEMKKLIPMRRLGKPEEISGVISFLVSDKASYITGAVINATGGLYT